MVVVKELTTMEGTISIANGFEVSDFLVIANLTNGRHMSIGRVKNVEAITSGMCVGFTVERATATIGALAK